jgi:hypothetical protein
VRSETGGGTAARGSRRPAAGRCPTAATTAAAALAAATLAMPAPCICLVSVIQAACLHICCSAVLVCVCALTRLANLKEVAGCEAKLRMEGDKPYVTDNSNYIVDLYFQVRRQLESQSVCVEAWEQCASGD